MTAGIEEDLSDRKILEGGTNFRWAYKQKFWSVWLPSREGVKDNKNVIWDLSLSLLECVNNHLSAAAGNFLQVANEIVGNYCRDYPLNILGDPGADSGDEGKSKRAEKYDTKKSKDRREEPLVPTERPAAIFVWFVPSIN